MGIYLVTGVGGFIGAAVAQALLDRGDEVVGVDNFTTGSPDNVPAGVDFYQGNCQDRSVYFDKIPRKPYAAILHIAGQSSGEISFDDPAYDLQTNTESTLHLLQYALAVGCKRFIYASTMSVYGAQPDEPIAETASTIPLSFYGVGKLASEHYLRLYEQYGISSTALRLFNVYGQGQNMTNMRQGMVSIFMTMMVNDGHIHIKGSPNRYRDFVHINDVVSAFLLSLERPQSGSKVLNVGGSGRVTVGRLVDTMQRLYSKPVTVEYSGCTAGDMFGIHADINQAAKYLGYEASISLQAGLEQMLAWYLNKVGK